MAGLSWAIWLAAPVVATLLAAVVLWWRGRPVRPLRTTETISGHRAYLDALTSAVSSRPPATAPDDRPARSETTDGSVHNPSG